MYVSLGFSCWGRKKNPSNAGELPKCTTLLKIPTFGRPSVDLVAIRLAGLMPVTELIKFNRWIRAVDSMPSLVTCMSENSSKKNHTRAQLVLVALEKTEVTI